MLPKEKKKQTWNMKSKKQVQFLTCLEIPALQESIYLKGKTLKGLLEVKTQRDTTKVITLNTKKKHAISAENV